MKQQSFIFLGRYGAGKGTQANLLQDMFMKNAPSNGVIHIDPGAEFRKLVQSEGFTPKTIKERLEKGYLMPEFLPTYIWANILVNSYKGTEFLIFDGAARKLPEAQMLETIFPFYGLEKPWVIHLEVHHEESAQRLKLRAARLGRKDDSPEALVKRRTAFEEEAVPTITYFKTSPHVRYVDVNGIGTIEEVHQRILKAVGLQK